MSKHHNGRDFSSLQMAGALLAAVVGYLLLVLLVAKVFGVTNPVEVAEPAAASAKVEANIKPVAEVELATAGAAGGKEKSGEEVVKAVCSMCHGAGLMGAPKIGDKGQWAPRITQGYDTLVKHALSGIRSMPARGGNPALTDGEIAGAVKFMANASGAGF